MSLDDYDQQRRKEAPLDLPRSGGPLSLSGHIIASSDVPAQAAPQQPPALIRPAPPPRARPRPRPREKLCKTLRVSHSNGNYYDILNLNGADQPLRRQATWRSTVDTKKKELIGDFKNAGRELRPKGSPERVRTHDYKDKTLGKVNPYGVYDVAQDTGWVSVGIDHDTAAFAVASIRGWWEQLGSGRYPEAKTLTITADCGGSNGNRTRLWKTELQRLADQTGLQISVCHFPPGTSKWNKIEHRLFSFISMNWRAKPLVSRQTVIDLIAATTTRTGLEVFARLDEQTYPKVVGAASGHAGVVKMGEDAGAALVDAASLLGAL